MKRIGEELESWACRLPEERSCIGAFEQWLYSTPSLAEELGPDDYLRLLSIDYAASAAPFEAAGILEKRIGAARVERRRLLSLLTHALEATGDDLAAALISLYDLYCRGYRFLRDIALGYGLACLHPPAEYGSDAWERLAAREKERLLGSFAPRLRADLRRAVDWLEGGAIRMLDDRDQRGTARYVDGRSSEETRSALD